MKKVTDTRTPETIDAKSMELMPTPARIDLKSIDDVRLEMARVYREMRSNTIESQEGTRLIYALAQIGKMIEVHEIEKRLEILEAGGIRKLESISDNERLSND